MKIFNCEESLEKGACSSFVFLVKFYTMPIKCFKIRISLCLISLIQFMLPRLITTFVPLIVFLFDHFILLLGFFISYLKCRQRKSCENICSNISLTFTFTSVAELCTKNYKVQHTLLLKTMLWTFSWENLKSSEQLFFRMP